MGHTHLKQRWHGDDMISEYTKYEFKKFMHEHQRPDAKWTIFLCHFWSHRFSLFCNRLFPSMWRQISRWHEWRPSSFCPTLCDGKKSDKKSTTLLEVSLPKSSEQALFPKREFLSRFLDSSFQNQMKISKCGTFIPNALYGYIHEYTTIHIQFHYSKLFF